MATAVTPLTPKRKRTVIGTSNDPRDVNYRQLPGNTDYLAPGNPYAQATYYIAPDGTAVPLPGQGGSVGGAATPLGATQSPASATTSPAPAAPTPSAGGELTTRAGSPSSIRAEEITGQKRRARRKASAPRGTPGLARRPTTVTTLSQPASPLGGG